jgi:hypothetical protein
MKTTCKLIIVAFTFLAMKHRCQRLLLSVVGMRSLYLCHLSRLSLRLDVSAYW